MDETRIFSTAVVTPAGQIAAEIVLGGGMIVAIEGREAPSAGALDWAGDMVIPGLVDIHTDNLEKHYQPRPGALWDAYGAALAHDAQCATAGVTTVLDSLSLHGAKDGLDRMAALGPMISAMDAATSDGALRAEHLLHLRCELPNPGLLEVLEAYIDHPRLRLLSVMDHTPGQRQMSDPNRARERMLAAGRTEEEVDTLLETRGGWRDPSAADRNRRAVAAYAREFGLPLAAHDDATIEHVNESHDDGCGIAEFPVTLEAAQRSRTLGLAICMGAPNFVRGGSHSGNLSARAAAEAGLLDMLTSDYIPLSMLRAAFLLMDLYQWAPQDAVRTVSRAPALSVGLTDRGELAPGLRADLVRVSRRTGGWPTPREVWRSGCRIA